MANDKSIKWKKDDNNGICIFIILMDIIIKMQSIINYLLYKLFIINILFSCDRYEIKKEKRKNLTLKIEDRLI